MPVINTNVNAIIARNAGAVNDRSMTKAMQSLSTGKRINVAADDAAGLAISTKMTSQIRGLDQAVRNANDGISMLQVVEGATVEMTNMLQRMRELAVQSANDTNTTAERSYLNDEFVQLRAEINRIASTTQWNGQNVMKGDGAVGTAFDDAGLDATVVADLGGATAVSDLGGRVLGFQVGANADETINFQVGNFTISPAGTAATDTVDTLNVNTAVANVAMSTFSTMTMSDGTNTYTVDLSSATNFTGLTTANLTANSDAAATALQTAIQNADTNLRDVTVTSSADGVFEIADDQGREWTISFSDDGAAASAITSDVIATAGASAADGTLFNFAAIDMSNAGEITLTANLKSVTVDLSAIYDPNWDTFAAALEDELQLNTNFQGSTVTSDSNGTFTIIANDGTADQVVSLTSLYTAERTTAAAIDTDFYTVAEVAGEAATGTPNTEGVFYDAALQDQDIETTGTAQDAIDSLDTALTSLNAQRSAIGATINRLTYAADNLTNTSANVTAARSRVLDTDYASATTELARTQIIQQASTAMLAQANQGAQSVLSLLK